MDHPSSFCYRCARRLQAGMELAGSENLSEREVSQEELVKRNTPPGASRHSSSTASGATADFLDGVFARVRRDHFVSESALVLQDLRGERASGTWLRSPAGRRSDNASRLRGVRDAVVAGPLDGGGAGKSPDEREAARVGLGRCTV